MGGAGKFTPHSGISLRPGTCADATATKVAARRVENFMLEKWKCFFVVMRKDGVDIARRLGRWRECFIDFKVITGHGMRYNSRPTGSEKECEKEIHRDAN